MVDSPQRILIVQPSWVGDAVMATPALRAIRELYPQAHISYLLRRYVKPIYAGMPWADRLITYRTGKTSKKAGRGGAFRLAARLRKGKFDLAILLPNSFRTAALMKLARIPRVVGYDRDGRGFLLTDRLLPYRERGRFVPTPMVKTYLGIAHYLGSPMRDLSLRLFVTPAERIEAEALLEHVGRDRQSARPGAQGAGPWVILNPGAQYGAAKCWLPEYFAAVSDRLVDELGATVFISGSPRERPIIAEIQRHTKRPTIDLASAGMSLGALKEVVRRCDLMITNDTGPRHIAAAMDVPVVTIFGPTHPDWTQIYFEKERQVMVKVFCGPCQKKKCPLDHRCMTRLTPAMVFDAAAGLLGRPSAPGLHVLAKPG
ncbi:MAG TPA: lipopolysaccharide heptosyltransferase II [Tepidisphaeraceae bacterium]|nr:lipopolysaccharide heptosyltransferase II [Tepidisphaeraceae bacterium]